MLRSFLVAFPAILVLVTAPLYAENPASLPANMDTIVSSVDMENHESETLSVFSAPEPSRAVLLIVGILTVTVAYRRAWVNLRNASQASE